MTVFCPRCDAHALVTVARPLVRVVAGRFFRTSLAIERCEVCDFSPIPVNVVDAFERAIATEVALFGPATNETFRFLRRALDLDVEEAARAIGATIEDVRGWESRRRLVPVATWLALAWLMRDRAAAEDRSPRLSVVLGGSHPALASAASRPASAGAGRATAEQAEAS